MACTITEGTLFLCSPNENQIILSPASNFSSDENSSNSEPKRRGRKRCLDHLSLEEKILRKKLKNREAAQVSRDRKKARMDQLEYTMELLIKENKESAAESKKWKSKVRELAQENERLKLKNRELAQENERLKSNSNTDTNSSASSCNCSRFSQKKRESIRDTLSELVSDITQRPAVSDTPLQKEVVVSQAGQILCLLCLYLTLILTIQKKNGTGYSKALPRSISPSSKIWQMISSRCHQNHSLRKTKMLKWWGPHQSSWNPVAVANAPPPV